MARRKKKNNEADNHERWLVSYADFMTLLFAFFTILFATSQQDSKKTKEFESSVKKYLMRMGAFVNQNGQNLNQNKKFNSPMESPLTSFPKDDPVKRKAQLKVETFMEEKLSNKQLEKAVNEITSDAFGVRVSLAASELFPTNSAKLKREALPLLDNMAKMFKKSGKKIMVEGHMDNKPFKSQKYSSSWELSSIRATKIVRYFKKIHGISGSKLAAISYGGERPMVPNNNEESRQRNRRIDFLLLTQDIPL